MELKEVVEVKIAQIRRGRAGRVVGRVAEAFMTLVRRGEKLRKSVTRGVKETRERLYLASGALGTWSTPRSLLSWCRLK